MLLAVLLISLSNVQAQLPLLRTSDLSLSLDINSLAIRLFGNYIQSNTKAYSSREEYRYRFSIFAKNLNGVLGTQNGILSDKVSIVDTPHGSIIKVKQPNGACDFEMTLNSFFDLTDEEFKRYYLLPPEFFDTKKYKPVSKIVQTIDGVPKLTALDDNFDPFEELSRLEEGKAKTPRITPNFLKDLLGFTDKDKNKEKIIQELKSSFDIVKRKVSVNNMLAPEDQGLPSVCQTQYRIKASIQNGVSNVKYSYSQIPSNLDFSHVFTERKLQNTLNFPNKYLKQNFTNFVDLNGIKMPGFLDWNQIAPLTPVKDQGKCNSCYVFSATSALEAHNGIINDISLQIAEQEILDCSRENKGCTGGQPYLVYDYIINNGITYDNMYPYRSSEGTCMISKNFSQFNRFSGLKGYVFPRPGILNLIRALQYGPVVIIMYASDHLKYYYKGIYEGQGCNGNEVPNHSALLYGYNLNSPKPYFMLKNGWGTNWGDNGHFKMSVGPLTADSMGHCYIAKTRYNVVPILKK